MNLKYFVFSSHLDDGEEIIVVAHRHPYIFLRDSFKTLIFAVTLPVTMYLLIPKTFLISFIWLIIGFFAMLYHFIDWFFDAWLITNIGVIDIERNGLFDRNSTRVDYHMIEGISFSISKVIPTILNFGNITLDKIGAQTSLVLKDASNPKKVEKYVLHNQKRFVNDKSYRDHNALKDMLSEMIAYHVKHNKIKVPKND